MPETFTLYRDDGSYCGPISMLVQMACGDILPVYRQAEWRGRVTHMDPSTRT